MVELLPCPFCGNAECYVGEHPESVWDFVVTCDACGTSGPSAGWGYRSALCSTKEDAHAKAIELWNNRAVIDETEHWAGVVEQTIANGRAGFLEFARIMSKPGVSFTAEQDAAIKAAVEMGNTAEAQRIILDALEVASKQTS